MYNPGVIQTKYISIPTGGEWFWIDDSMVLTIARGAVVALAGMRAALAVATQAAFWKWGSWVIAELVRALTKFELKVW